MLHSYQLMSRFLVHLSISLYLCFDRQRSVLGECLSALSAAFPMCFLELTDLHSLSDTMSNEEGEGKGKKSSIERQNVNTLTLLHAVFPDGFWCGLFIWESL